MGPVPAVTRVHSSTVAIVRASNMSSRAYNASVGHRALNCEDCRIPREVKLEPLSGDCLRRAMHHQVDSSKRARQGLACTGCISVRPHVWFRPPTSCKVRMSSCSQTLQALLGPLAWLEEASQALNGHLVLIHFEVVPAVGSPFQVVPGMAMDHEDECAGETHSEMDKGTGADQRRMTRCMRAPRVRRSSAYLCTNAHTCTCAARRSAFAAPCSRIRAKLASWSRPSSGPHLRFARFQSWQGLGRRATQAALPSQVLDIRSNLYMHQVTIEEPWG